MKAPLAWLVRPHYSVLEAVSGGLGAWMIGAMGWIGAIPAAVLLLIATILNEGIRKSRLGDGE